MQLVHSSSALPICHLAMPQSWSFTHACWQVLDQRQAQSAAPAFHLACLSFVELVR